MKNVLQQYCKGIFDCEHKTAPLSESGFPSIRTPNIGQGRLILENVNLVSEEIWTEWTKRAIPEYMDLIIAREAPAGNVALVPKDVKLCLGQRTVLLKPDHNKIDPAFLCYYLLSPKMQNELLSKSAGSTVPHINVKDIKNLNLFTLPRLSEQRKIASILSAYDDLIENNLRRIKLLEEVARRTYEEWFVKLKVKSEKLKVDKGTGLPEGWERVKLKDILEFNYGKALKSDERIPGNIPVYGSSGVVGSHTFSLVKGPGIIVGRKGNVGSVFWSENNFYPIDTVYFVTSNTSLYFLYFNLKSQNFINNDAAVPGLNRNAAYMAESFLPKREIIERFSDVIKPIFDLHEKLEKQNRLYKEARDILLPRLMSGEMEV